MPLDPGLLLPTLSAHVQRLEHAWGREYPKRASGALNALSGFRYQFLVVLLETVRKWLTLPRPEQARVSLFTERLSDLLGIEGERAVIVTQIKKTASSPQVRSALEELWRIHRLAVAETPELARLMRYRILASNGTLVSIERVRDEWKFEGATAIELVEFKDRVEAVLETDPEDELLALLVNELHAGDPLARIYDWHGKLIEAADCGSFKTAAKTIWDDLIGLAAADDKPPGAFVWTSEDRPPREVRRGRFLAGRQPLVKDLKAGNFAPRRKVYDQLTAHAQLWIESDPAALDQGLRIPVFWIEGRSGSGKSVALLHLLARLHDEGHGPIIWLADKILSLPETMQWARRLQQKERRVIIALDDPFAPGEQTDSARVWREALAVMQDAREGNRPEELPLILCCGPTEQADSLEAELLQDLLIERHELPHETREELNELRNWFLLRTGTKAPEIGDDNVLLVQVFFEWRVGKTLPVFADHFRRRLRAADSTGTILGFVTRLLVLNRIYVGYPPAVALNALTGRQRDALNRLRRDEHIAEDRHGRRGIWLAHPHLSNAIYEHWHPISAATREERKEHLLAAIRECLHHGESPRARMAPLWALTHAYKGTAQGDTLAERVEPELVSELLVEIYTQELSPTDMPLSELPVWIELRGLQPDLALDPDPTLLAIDAIHINNLEQTGLRLTCHKLLGYRDHFSEPLRIQSSDAIIRLLSDSLSLNWKEWQPVAIDAVDRLRDPRLWPLVNVWVRLHPFWRETAKLMNRALSVSGGDFELLKTSQELLQRAPADLAWGDLAVLLLDQNPESVLPAVEQWTQVQRREFSACFVLHKLLEKQFMAAEGWGMEWAEIWHRERSAGFVLESLCRYEIATPELRDWSCTWISLGKADGGFLLERLFERFPEDDQVFYFAHQWLLSVSVGNASWGFIWNALRKRYPADLDLEQLARQWLRSAPPEHGSWSFVWRPLWDAAPANPELAEIAKGWFLKVPAEHAAWSFVWQPLWNAAPADPELDQLARQWLRKVSPDHKSWTHVWGSLWEFFLGNPELNQLAKQWLRNAPPDHKFWKFVWRDLWSAAPADPELKEIAKGWLHKVTAEHASWSFVWRPLWDAAPADPELAEIAKDWLGKVAPAHGSWHFVWQPLWDAALADPELDQLARQWLRKVSPEHKSWKHVWETLWKFFLGDPELSQLAKQWLRNAPPDHKFWKFVWEDLWSAAPADPELAEIAKDWLGKVAPAHGSWHFVWQPLWDAAPADPELKEIAKGWLHKVTAEHASWSFVWRPLWDAAPANPELAELAKDWLRKVPAEHASWSFVWQPLWDAAPADPELAEIAKDWLRKVAPAHGSWHFVWQPLWDAAPADPELAAIAKDWLRKVAPVHGSWHFVWQPLWNAAPADSELDQLARQWLRRVSPDHKSWKHVWETLWKYFLGDPELDQLAKQWLLNAPPDHKFWKFVWEDLWSAAPANPELKEIANGWLHKVAPAHGSWHFVWQPLWDAAPADPELAEIAKVWLRKVPAEHASWSFVWQTLWDAAPADPELGQLAKQWLLSATTQPKSWSFVWEHLWSENPNDLELETLGRQWLRATSPDSLAWVFVWKPLMTKVSGDPELTTMALQWLRGASPGHGSWPYIWQRLWNTTPGDRDLANLAREWLSNAPPERDSWGYVWEDLWKVAPEDGELKALGNCWLRATLPQNRSWTCVWRPMIESQPGDLGLTGLARNWLLQASGHSAWAEVWTILWRRSPRDEELFRLAQQWLQGTSLEHEGREIVIETISAWDRLL